MKKIFTQQFMGVLAGLASIILSITLYAYKSDQDDINDKMEIEVIQRRKSDADIKAEFRREDEEIKAEFRAYDSELKEDIAKDIEDIKRMQAETRSAIRELLKRK